MYFLNERFLSFAGFVRDSSSTMNIGNSETKRHVHRVV